MRAALVATLLCCQGCAVPVALTSAWAVASTTYAVVKDVNSGLQVEADAICTLWGAVWKNPTPDSVSGLKEDVAIFCSGSPAIGDTPVDTLADLWGKVQAIRAAQLAA